MDHRERESSPKPFFSQPDVGLYSFGNEHDACGIGFVADLNNKADHSIVTRALTVLEKLTHRGSAGNDVKTGDGAGILTSLPDAFFRAVVGTELPARGRYGVAMLFGAKGKERLIDRLVKAEGCTPILWRAVPTDDSTLGVTAKKSCPSIHQLFIAAPETMEQDAFERKLYVIRRQIEKNVDACYPCSCSSRSIVYKGLLLASQIGAFYLDLQDERYVSPLALVHQRYSTNTLPAWHLAQPFRMLAHNGEINTLRGNLNHIRAAEPSLKSVLLGDDLQKILPVTRPDQSDSACLDNVFELLCASGRTMTHSMVMMIPQAWGQKYHLGQDVRGFLDYHSALMPPWDGPAAVAFSDGVNIGAILDRNGLRPARYKLTKDNLFVLASETGVLPIPAEDTKLSGRLAPGSVIFCDLENHRLLFDNEVKSTLARQAPYRRWVNEKRISVQGFFDSVAAAAVPDDLHRRQRLFGYTKEDVETLIAPMASTGGEATGAMGNDAALAFLSAKPQSLFAYFKQRFAQVTNPPIDSIREALVMSLMTFIGNRGNILEEGPEHAAIIKLPSPVLTAEDVCRLSGATIRTGFTGGEAGLRKALRRISSEAVSHVRAGQTILVLSDRDLGAGELPIPALLALSAVNRALTEAGLRPSAGLIVQSGEVRETMHVALLLGYGATAVSPYLAFETVSDLCRSGLVALDPAKASDNFIKAIDKGLLKIMSKMGISTLRSYRGAQIFEALGLNESFVEEWFPGTPSRVGGIGLREIAANVARMAEEGANDRRTTLPPGGAYRWRHDGEKHLWTPDTIALFRQASWQNDAAAYAQYARLINEQSDGPCTLRSLLKFKKAKKPLPLSKVEPVESILKHFVSGAMSLGSLSPEAHEAIAIAMNAIGGMSNSGEGGEDPDRATPGPNGENRSSAIRQVASGRFGVTISYLAGGREIQIKMAQGAKPGEGGQLPGFKVDEFVAKVRHAVPGISLISPPPHHDIYSIEDFAQLIFDLRCTNPHARISTKLVSEAGIGTIAAGVAKAHSDVILVSGYDGGTGASPQSSIKHAGLPWELGLAEAHQALLVNRLRNRVRLQVDGQLKTGRDVMIGALLGAQEFGFATTILVALGCGMLRKCNENNCPFGVATQDPECRKHFRGRPEYIVNFLRFVAEEVRGYLAELGLKSLDEAVGRADLLESSPRARHYHADFSKILHYDPVLVRACNREGTPRILPEPYDETHLLPKLADAVAAGTPAKMELPIVSTDRVVGTGLSGEIARHWGEAGLPDGTFDLTFHGVAGQSFGAFLARGVRLTLVGEANDTVGKGLSGGTVIVRPEPALADEANRLDIVGNVVGYGGTSGKLFINGRAGERFCIRNSGITAVVEGVGDHGCEYMTGGRVVILGPAGINFAAGMTGGLAYVYDADGSFDLRCNLDTVDLEPVAAGSEAEAELTGLMREHIEATGSHFATYLLEHWDAERAAFVRVVPVEYRKFLAAAKGGQH